MILPIPNTRKLSSISLKIFEKKKSSSYFTKTQVNLQFCFHADQLPGGPLLNPLDLGKDIKNAHEWKLKEIKNGLFCLILLQLL